MDNRRNLTNHIGELALGIGADIRTAFCVRVSAAEHERIKKMMNATGMSGPELFRRSLLSRLDLEQPLFSPELAKEFATELKRQGTNINQIAKKVNSGLFAGWSQALSSLNVNYLKLSHMLTVNYASR